MKRTFVLGLVTALVLAVCSNPDHDHEIELFSDSFQITLNREGFIQRFVDRATNRNYLFSGAPAPLLSVQIQSEIQPPLSADYDKSNQIIALEFKNENQAKIKVTPKNTHLTFELIEMSGVEQIDLIIWGPYPTTIKKIIGETIGVVRGEKFALGIQALNIKTLGGYPWNQNDHLPQTDIFDSEEGYDLAKGRKGVLYSVEAAKPTEYGSTLQAYCRDRSRDRIIPNWDHERYVVPAYEDGGIIGSKIALFGCRVEETLKTIGDIELAEGLPHPRIDGQWSKTTPAAAAAYVILNFSERDFDKALEITRKAGLSYVYHSDPFETWGHFELKKSFFPDGEESLKRCVDKARSAGIKVGLHTLSNFVTTNDAYVTPIPDRRLARVGSSTLTQDIDSKQKDILIEAPDYFNQFKRNFLKAAVIGDELIRYGGVSEEAPWTLLDCQRGAFGTTASSHKKAETIGKLADHGYKVFLTNAALTVEMAKTIAALFNATGVRQISFDGLEGNHSTGMGNYGEALFTKTWFDHLDEDIQRHYIADASRSGHFFWHIYTRMNWGEPWYAGFRESQTDYRLRNQKYFQRNFMPGMLGWFRMTSATSLEDIEWMLARSAAYDAGYAFYTDYQSLQENGFSEDILELLGEWEQARMSGVFNENQKQQMQDIKNEFHLASIGEKEWNLTRIYSHKFTHENKERQPGEPLSSDFSFDNPAGVQPMNFLLTSGDGAVGDIRIELDHFKHIDLPVTLQPEQSLRYSGGNTVSVYSQNWQKLHEIVIDADALILTQGVHTLTFDCSFAESTAGFVKLEVRLSSKAEHVKVD